MLAWSACPATGFEGKVTEVQDGNTLSIASVGGTLRVRLAEIDAPDLRQPHGVAARQALSELCLDRPAMVEFAAAPAGGRVTGWVKCDGTEAGSSQVERGMAWVRKHSVQSTSPLYFLEDQAQRQKLGLWADPMPVPPWQWRRRK